MSLLLLIAGLGILIAGAEMLVKGASRLAIAMRISPLVIGLTVVAFGTSSPEFAVSIKAAVTGKSDIAVGNVVGSNVFNILVILGMVSILAPLRVSRQLVQLDVPLLLAASFLVMIFSLDRRIGRAEGLLLFLCIVAYTVFLVYACRRGAGKMPAEAQLSGEALKSAAGRWWKDLAFVVAGLALLILGARWFVNGAVDIAGYFGLSELIIGLTLVAFGTSLPEAVTSILASLRGKREIAVGNAIGSSLFNLLGVLGLAALLAPQGIAVSRPAIGFDIPVMIAVAFACLPVFVTGGVIARWEGAVFVGYYAAYVLYLTLAATKHNALPLFSATMWCFVIPLTLITVLIVVARSMRTDQSSPSP